MKLDLFRRAYARKTILEMAAEYVVEKDTYHSIALYEEMTRRTGVERTQDAIHQIRQVSKMLGH